ncbi:MAG: DNA primase [Myxococcota bacterium]
MGRIPDDTLQAVRDRVDIVDLVGRHVGLKKAGRSFKGLCPFHHEKTPSFVVTPERGTWHCFGCGEGGNAFAFLMRHENLTFPEAVRSLAAELGIEIPETSSGERGVLEGVLRANALAHEYYQRALSGDEGRGAREYLAERGLGEDEARRFGVGFAPDRWEGVAEVLRRARIPGALGERAGLVRARSSGGHYDMLRGRVVFPIQDARGRVIGFGGRAMAPDQEPKYLNTPESPAFRKREAFYGLPAALEPMRSRDRAVVVEGYFDQIALARAGMGEAIATCGTALSAEHAKGLSRRTRNVVLLFDGDEAGQRAMLRALEAMLPVGLRVRAAALPGGVDPDDFLRRDGAEALARLVDEAPPALEIAIARAAAAGCRTPWERSDAVAAVAPLLALVADPVERGEFGRRLALAVGADPEDVVAALRRERKGGEPEPAPAAPRRTTDEERHFATLLRLLLEHPAELLPVDESALLAVAPDAEWGSLASSILAASPGALDALLDALEGEPRLRLSELANAPRPDLELAERAPRIFRDELGWLMKRRDAQERSAVKARIAGGDPDALQELQRRLERRAAARSVPPGRSSFPS